MSAGVCRELQGACREPGGCTVEGLGFYRATGHFKWTCILESLVAEEGWLERGEHGLESGSVDFGRVFEPSTLTPSLPGRMRLEQRLL